MTFAEVDEALYLHERAFYRYCATGAGENPSRNPCWVEKRKQLTAIWYQLRAATPIDKSEG